MFKQKRVAAFVLFFALAIFLTIAQAAEVKIPLMGKGVWKKASGEAVIKDAEAGQKEITIDAKGLKKNGVYTAWFVNMKPKMEMAGIGAGDYSFKSDDKGEGHYTAKVSASDLDKWQMIEIAYHPTGNPMDMKKMKIALAGELKK